VIDTRAAEELFALVGAGAIDWARSEEDAPRGRKPHESEYEGDA
jgi:hypothetical protein